MKFCAVWTLRKSPQGRAEVVVVNNVCFLDENNDLLEMDTIPKVENEPPKILNVDKEPDLLERGLHGNAAVEVEMNAPQDLHELGNRESPSSSGNECETLGDNLEENIPEKLSRANRRKLTRSLLRECSLKPLRGSRRKAPPSASVRKRVPRIFSDETIQDSEVESFDTFLKYPKDIICPDTVEGFCSRPNDKMRSLYEDYMANVRGEGIPVHDLEAKLLEKLECLEKELSDLKEAKAKLEEEDDLGAEPFLDYVAYRMLVCGSFFKM
ncbi:hypothetical protein OSTOST_07596 [Ostertagia ostertagi]